MKKNLIPGLLISASVFLQCAGVMGNTFFDGPTTEQAEARVKELATEVAKLRHPELFKESIQTEETKTIIKGIVEEIQKGNVDPIVKDVDGVEKKFSEVMKAMQDQAEVQAQSIKELQEKLLDGQVNQVMAQIKAQFDQNADALKNVAQRGNGSVRFEVKAANSPISVSSFGDRVIFGLRESGIDREPLPQRFIFDIIQVMNGGVGSNPLSWVEQVAGEGAPAWTAESAAKPAMNWTYIENKVTAEMIAVYTIVTRQALLNWAILEQEIRGELSRKLYNKLDQSVLNGNGAANSIFGINYYATDFAAGSLAGTVIDANVQDVLRAAIGQVRKGGEFADPELGGFNPTFIIISEDASTRMDLGKNANGTYLLPAFTSVDNTVVKGVRVITTNFIGDDDFIVGDFSRYLFNIVDGLKIDVGYINEQFIHNQLTIRAELYGMGRVKNHEKPAFVKGNFTDAIAELSATT